MIYEMLTQIIIVLGRLRTLSLKHLHYDVRNERTFRLVTADSGRHCHICCDCGLEHLDRVEGDKLAVIWSKPMRPIEYKYGLRHGAGTPSEHHSPAEWKKIQDSEKVGDKKP